jgi:hypothetical protein
LLTLALAAACGGSTPPAEAPEEEDDDDIEQTSASEGTTTAEGEEESSEKPKPEAAEPEFKDGMSVDEAINAVPQGTERENIEQETLARPLTEAKLYARAIPGQPRTSLRSQSGTDAPSVSTSKPSRRTTSSASASGAVRQVQWREKVNR